MKKSKAKKHPLTAPETSEPPIEGPRYALAILIGLYLLLALGAALVVPADPVQAPKLVPPDEPAHWAYVVELASGKGLPTFASGTSNYEAHQPPLYYLSALWCAWLGGTQGLLLARLWSALLGVGTLLAAWQALRYLLGEAFWPRLAAIAALAFLPGRLFIVSSVSNDPMFELWATLTLWQLLKALHEGITPRRSVYLGVCLGLALLSKSTGIVLIPLAVLAAVSGSLTKGNQSPESTGRSGSWIANTALMLLATGLIWGWWVVRNLVLYGDPLAMGVFQQIFLKDRATPEYFLSHGMTWGGYWTLVAYQAQMSLWGVFGQATIYMPLAFYRIGYALEALAVVGLAAEWWRFRTARPAEADGESAARIRCWGAAILLLFLTLATFLRFNTVFYQAQARYFLGASAVGAAILAAGLYGLARGRSSPWPALLLTLLLAALSVWAIWAHVAGSYSLMPPGLL
jgi:4-amino-4-deoxy-L-arabinose transferase-like glycosyltransferase